MLLGLYFRNPKRGHCLITMNMTKKIQKNDYDEDEDQLEEEQEDEIKKMTTNQVF